jgi:prephenate dehydrogenase
MWLDICMANKAHIMPLIQELCMELQGIKQMLEQNQTKELYDTFTYARNARQRFLDQYQKL